MLISNDKTYNIYSYHGKEDELQEVVEQKSKDIFGEYSFFFPKKKLTSNRAELGTIPDGFILDLSDPGNPS